MKAEAELKTHKAAVGSVPQLQCVTASALPSINDYVSVSIVIQQ
jgi:hypothetical protein